MGGNNIKFLSTLISLIRTKKYKANDDFPELGVAYRVWGGWALVMSIMPGENITQVRWFRTYRDVESFLDRSK